MLPVAPGGTGQPPSSPKLDSNEAQPACSAASTFARPWPRVLWKCAVSWTSSPSAARGACEVLGDLDRVRHAGRVAEGDLRAPASAQPARRCRARAALDGALVGAAEARRDDRLDAQPGLARPRDDPVEAGERRVDRAVDVAPVVRLAGRQEDADLLEAVAQLERAVEAALVGDQHAARDARRDVDRRQHLARVGELRDDVGAHEARHLDAPQAACARAGR